MSTAVTQRRVLPTGAVYLTGANMHYLLHFRTEAGQILGINYLTNTPFITQLTNMAETVEYFKQPLTEASMSAFEQACIPFLANIENASILFKDSNKLVGFIQHLTQVEADLFNIPAEYRTIQGSQDNAYARRQEITAQLQTGLHLLYYNVRSDNRVRKILTTLHPETVAAVRAGKRERKRTERPTIISTLDVLNGRYTPINIDGICHYDSVKAESEKVPQMEGKAFNGLMIFPLGNYDWRRARELYFSADSIVAEYFGVRPDIILPPSFTASPMGGTATSRAGAIREIIMEFVQEASTTTAGLPIQFEKLNGEIRNMRTSRNPVHEGAYHALNTPETVQHNLNRGLVSVFDLDIAETRQFNVNRLHQLTLQGRMVSFEEEIERRLGVAAEGPPVDELANSASSMYSVAEMVDVLRGHVVRLVVRTEKNDKRVMFATRNSDVIETYSKSTAARTRHSEAEEQERYEKMVETGLITVFDLTVQEFRSFHRDKLYGIDVDNMVPAWIEFDAKIGDWYSTVKGTKTIEQTYSGTGYRGRDLIIADRDRLEFEAQAFKYQMFRADAELQMASDTEYEERSLASASLVQRALASVPSKDYTSYDLEVMQELVTHVTALNEALNENPSGGVAVSEMKTSVRDKLIVLTINWGQAVYYFHPRFVIGGVSHKNYVDRTGVMDELLRTKTGTIDTVMDAPIAHISEFVSARRKADLFTKVPEGADIRRVLRISELVKKEAATLAEQQIKIAPVKGYPAQLKVTINKKQTFLLNHEYIYDLVHKRYLFIRTPEVTYQNTLEAMHNAAPTAEIKTVLALVLQACDLRRAVEDSKGVKL